MICSVEECFTSAWFRSKDGYCIKHQRRVDRHGDPHIVRGYRSIEERFLDKTALQSNGCLIWIGNINEKGYGRFFVDGKYHPAHTWAYEHFVGPILEGYEPDHLCRNRSCVNTDHLEIVTHQENCQRAFYIQEFCKKGHPLPEPRPNGRRPCRPCANERNRAYKQRLKEGSAYESP